MINDRMVITWFCIIFWDGGFLTLPSCSISEGDKLCSKFALLFFVQDIFLVFSDKERILWNNRHPRKLSYPNTHQGKYSFSIWNISEHNLS